MEKVWQNETGFHQRSVRVETQIKMYIIWRFTIGDNQTEAIIEEFTLECVGSNLFNVTPAKDSTWFLNVSEADSHKIAFVVDIPINITTGTWLMVLSLQSPDSSHFHNFLLCSVEIV